MPPSRDPETTLVGGRLDLLHGPRTAFLIEVLAAAAQGSVFISAQANEQRPLRSRYPLSPFSLSRWGRGPTIGRTRPGPQGCWLGVARAGRGGGDPSTHSHTPTNNLHAPWPADLAVGEGGGGGARGVKISSVREFFSLPMVIDTCHKRDVRTRECLWRSFPLRTH